jgi:hypothetical protein
MNSLSSAELNLGETLADLGLGCTALEVWADLALAGFGPLGVIISLAGAAYISASHDPASPDINKLAIFRLPPSPLTLSSSPQDVVLQTTGFHATSMTLALTAFTTTHERYLGAVQQAIANPTALTVPLVKSQAVVLGANASSCASLCGSLASDMQNVSTLLAAERTNATAVYSPNDIATSVLKALPSYIT